MKQGRYLFLCTALPHTTFYQSLKFKQITSYYQRTYIHNIAPCYDSGLKIKIWKKEITEK